MKKVAIITSGFLPVPATKGGAVENLVVNLLKENEKFKNIQFNVLSVFDKKAQEEAKEYKYTTFTFFSPIILIKLLDNIAFIIAKKILRKKNSQSYRYIFQRLDYLYKCSKNLKKLNYDMILLENHPSQFLVLKWKHNYLKYENKYYYHCHNEFIGKYGCENIIKGTNKFICVSQFISNSVSKYLCMPNDKFVVLRNCVDFKKFKSVIAKREATEIKHKYNISDSDKVILFAGRIVPEKGVKELIESLKYVDYSNYKLMILGSALNELATKTEYQIEVEKLISNNSNIIFTGYVDYNIIYKFYQIADIAVVPSLCNEAASLSIIESLVSGLPIITTNSGGICEYAVEESAIVIEKDNNIVRNLGESITDLLKDETKMKRMSKSSLEVSKDLNLENYYTNFIKIIEVEK